MKNIGGNAVIIKEININLVKELLKNKGQATKQEIAKESGLSFVTVGSALQHLLQKNEIFETKLVQSNGGRPAQQYCYNYDFAHGLIIYLYEKNEKTLINISTINLAGEILEESEVEAENVNISTFETIIKEALEKDELIKVVSFGHHGIELNGQIIISDYKLLEGTSFSDYFSEKYNIPVILENDVHSAVFSFSKRRSVSESLVYLHFPENQGPSAGILIAGKLFKGHYNLAGEMSKLPLDIEWTKELYKSEENLCKAIAKMIVSICYVLNPNTVILNGNNLRQEYIEKIIELCKEALPAKICPYIYLSENFMLDYKNGLITKALEQLEPSIRLTEKV